MMGIVGLLSIDTVPSLAQVLSSRVAPDLVWIQEDNLSMK